MTLPAEHGYPDYQRQLTQADTLFLNDQNRTILDTIDEPAFFAGNYSHIGVSFQSIAGWFNVQIQYFADQALTILLSESEFVVRNGGLFVQSVPVLAPWIRVRVGVGTGPVWTFSALVWGTPAAFGWLPNPDENQIYSVAQSVPAASTTTISDFRTMTGVAHIAWLTALATWNISFRSLDSLGVSVRIFEVNNVGPGEGSATVALPALPTELRLNNQTGAAGNMNCQINVERGPNY